MLDHKIQLRQAIRQYLNIRRQQSALRTGRNNNKSLLLYTMLLKQHKPYKHGNNDRDYQQSDNI